MNTFESLKSICAPQLFPGLTPFFHTIEKLQYGKQNINIAILGQFKAGKSSFLNHLTGSTLLPVGVTPVTNVITILQYGQTKRITVTFLNGKTRIIQKEELPEYINEQINSHNYRQVEKVIIELPALEEFRGIRFIDTPGVGSLFSQNTQATLDFTPDTGLAIVAINPGNPLSEGDISLLEKLRTYTPRIYILLTKTDLYDRKDLDEIEQFIRKSLENHFREIYSVFRYSTRKDADFFRNEILNKIIHPMVSHKDKVFEEIAAYKTRSLSRSCLSYLEASYQASLKVNLEKEKLHNLILQSRENLQRQRNELQLITQSYASRTREQLISFILPYHQSVTRSLKDHFRKEYQEWRGNLYVITRKFEQWLGKGIEEEFSNLTVETEKKWMKLLRDPHNHLEKYLETARKQRNEEITRVLHISLHDQPAEIRKPDIKNPDVSVYWTFDSHLDLLWFLIPMVIFRKAFRGFFLNRIPDEIEKNLYRLVSQFTGEINKEIYRMKEDTLTLLRNDLITVEKILSSEKNETEILAEKIKTLKHMNLNISETGNNQAI